MTAIEAADRALDGVELLPPRCYTEPRFADADRALLRTSWLGVGRSDMVTTDQNYRTLDIAGTPVILTRSAEGTLHALANSCRHRGARLLDGEGTCRTIQCPFHAWSYAHDGALVAAPKMKEADGFELGDFGLHTYRVEERLGFAFLCLDPSAPDLDEVLGDFAAVHAPWPLEELVTFRRREFEVGCNWKAFLEVFNDYYHLPYVHRESLGNLYQRPEPRDDTVGAFTSQWGSTEGTAGLLANEQGHPLPRMEGLDDAAAAGVRYSWAFPTMTFAAGPESLWVYEAYPLGADRCRVVQSSCLPPATVADPNNADQIDAYLVRLDAALVEDIEVLENQHRGLSSPEAQQGRFQPRLEPSVAAFARWYRSQTDDVFEELS